MQRAKFILGAITLVILLVVSAQTGQAQLRQIELRVDGLSCPFCAYGLEKNLKAVKGVQDLKIDMDKGSVTLLPKEGAFIPVNRMLEAVRDGGFTPGELDLVIAGRVLTLAELSEDKEAMKAVGETRKAARKQGLKLPENPFLLTLEKPGQVFTLLKPEDKAHREAYERLPALMNDRRPVVITGMIPVPKKAKSVPMAMFVKDIKVEGEAPDAPSEIQ